VVRVVEKKAGSTAIMQRLACTMIGSALFVVCCLIGLLLTDALSPGRLPPMLAFYAACGAGLSLILGLVMLERRGVPHGIAAFEGR
jgi:hypothetical protein